jgi:hypothetical protein
MDAPEGGGTCEWRPATDMSMQGVQRKFATEVVTPRVQEATGTDGPRNKVQEGQQEGNDRSRISDKHAQHSGNTFSLPVSIKSVPCIMHFWTLRRGSQPACTLSVLTKCRRYGGRNRSGPECRRTCICTI